LTKYGESEKGKRQGQKSQKYLDFACLMGLTITTIIEFNTLFVNNLIN